MSNALIYVRVSTVEQADHGVSLEAQRAQARGYAAYKGLNVIEVISEQGVSGSVALAQRPGGARLMELVQSDHINTVIAVKLDGLFRDAADCLMVTKQWDEVGTNLHLIDMGGQAVDTSSSIGRFFLTVMAGVAEMERGLMIERTRAALGQLQAQGKRTGSIPMATCLVRTTRRSSPISSSRRSSGQRSGSERRACLATPSPNTSTPSAVCAPEPARGSGGTDQRMLRRAGVSSAPS